MDTTDLSSRHCRPHAPGTRALGHDEARALLAQVPGWILDETAGSITRDFRFADYYKTMAFVNALAWIAHREDHHPDMEVGYSHCQVRYSTHSAGGLTENDFICAARINHLLDG